MNKLIVVIMGPGNKNFIQMAYDSVKNTDKVLYFSGNHELVKDELCIDVHDNNWDESDKKTNGKSRNVYLKYLKENHPDDWCLVLDEDEVCEDINKIKEFIQTAKPGLYSPKMRHFIGDLGHEDATRKNHWVPNRLFKISEAKEYPLDSHPVLIPNDLSKQGITDCTTIWHLGHLPVEYMHYIVKRGNEHLDNSTIHNKEFLKGWKWAHLFGTYPKSQIDPTIIPKIILDNFVIDFDELYFEPRKQMESKHYQDAVDWKNYFNPDSVILWGCGFGQRVKVLKDLGIDAVGYELSEYAVKNGNAEFVRDITNKEDGGIADLVVAYDVLEHLKYEDLDSAIDNLMLSDKYILVSIPYKGTPNCDADPTHIIKEDRDWWVKKFTDKGLKEVEVPSHFLYRDQLLIFKK